MIDLLNKILQTDTETEVLEFKKAERQFDKDKLGKYFTALSNEANLNNLRSAYLLFGISNDKRIVGTRISDSQINEYKRETANNSSPTLNFIRVERIPTDQGNVILFEIPAAPKGMPVAWKNHYYARDGESLAGLSIEKIERIRDQVQDDWSRAIIPEASLTDLDKSAIEKARLYYSEKNPHLKEDIFKWNDITFLNKAKLTINGNITRTAILLLGKPESDHYLNPGTSKISWVLRDRDGIEKDYQHFFCPLLLEVDKVYGKIRNLKYRYIKEGTLFPDEVDQFEPFTIREALHNCIAHQDYRLGGKINLVEREDGILVFSNSGDFIPQSVENVIQSDAPEAQYRNPFLTTAMVNLNLIDTIGSGIKKMFIYQKNKYFPLPEYDFSNHKVTVSIIGKVMDVNYARKLAQIPDLSLHEIMLLDKVAKHKELTTDEIKLLRDKSLIEGRKPNFHISSIIAKNIGKQSEYIKMRGIEDEYSEKLICDYLKKFEFARKADLFEMLVNKFPDILSDEQKQHKLKNLLQKMKNSGIIDINEKRQWFLK
ncbi:Divergent AAA domain protein [Salinivirga cyanobacteriivorans]|uniref:Divergent AAA domain protein n=1 Tax=Salinivirga cyanobacteriivorans TaxID=1307839 RepID=A0A0S2HYE7_9BACT|nr:RNA-binding domain-containing protein [Salinivirga cyanobacteriivorans]ALO15051.1 Divergent AAA domain protein [Salinivirga cyanobacteriivorans]